MPRSVFLFLLAFVGCQLDPFSPVTDDTGTPEACAPPSQRCDGVCVDVSSAPAHCGSCEHACDDGQTCEGGFCTGGDTDTDTCTDDCSPPGARECHEDGVRTCGEHDGTDSCDEWSEVTPCGEGFVCDPDSATCVEEGDVELPAPFSIVLLPDTQYYTDKLPDDSANTYYLQAQWIIDHAASENIRFTVHLGDITDHNATSEWVIADKAHAMLDAAGVPYSVLPGNHDYKDGSDWGRGESLFADYFPASRFQGLPWYGGSYDSSNTNNYALFEVGSLEFMVLSLEYAPRKDVLCWAEQVIAAHPERRVLLATHCYQTHGGGYSSGCPDPDYLTPGSDGQTVWDELASRHSNVFLVAAGHVGDSEYRAKMGNVGNDVHEILVDYQFEGACSATSPEACTDNCRAGTYTGNGWLRLLRFDPQASTVTAETITVEDGNAGLFPGGDPVLFCSPLFNPTDPNADGGAWYDQDPTEPDHLYSFSLDLGSPVAYASDDLGLHAFNDRTVNSVASGDQDAPAVAITGDGAFVTAWEDDSSNADGSGNLDVLVRGFAPCGCEAFADLSASSDTGGDQREPALAVDIDGDFVVAWADDTDANGTYQIHARGFYADGTERIPEFAVNSVATGQQRRPAIGMASDGRFAIAWEDDQDRDGNYQVLVRGFAADGSEAFADRNVADDDEGERIRPSVGVDGSGNVVVAWQDDGDGNGVDQIRARGLSAAGVSRFGPVTVNSVATGQQEDPSLGVDSAGAFAVAWEDDQERDGDYQILTRSFSSSGTGVSEWTVASGGQRIVPSLSMTPGGAVAVAWQDDSDGNGMYQIKAATWHADGSAWRSSSTVNKESAGQQTLPAAGFADDGTLVVLWTDDMDGNGVGQILAAGFDAP